ncbi:hypothetical protein CABS03_13063 [Colletotrichum abscissum]|uniref:Uncharacterized protein n=2 Tax=Colletotrichum acutatum species complex TaxID=2707335 RepID=A0A9Q0B2A9_9PEZI|nr:hypothetical protein CABS02_08982 [Colletotrichum abscissum]KAK0381176.1 hypothetical protein CLIM01_01415 [Colletotrichum limetticola]
MGHGTVSRSNACWSTLRSLVRDKTIAASFEPQAAHVYPPKRLRFFSSSTCCFYFYPPTTACRLSPYYC